MTWCRGSCCYPKDRRHDAGFLVEQFPVTRAIYGHARQRRLRLRPARFVVPPGSPADAKAEARAIARLLGTRLTTVSELMPLLQLISKDALAFCTSPATIVSTLTTGRRFG